MTTGLTWPRKNSGGGKKPWTLMNLGPNHAKLCCKHKISQRMKHRSNHTRAIFPTLGDHQNDADLWIYSAGQRRGSESLASRLLKAPMQHLKLTKKATEWHIRFPCFGLWVFMGFLRENMGFLWVVYGLHKTRFFNNMGFCREDYGFCRKENGSCREEYGNCRVFVGNPFFFSTKNG